MATIKRNVGYVYAILAAVLFGASTPFAKILLGQIHPWLLAGLFYLGSSIGIFLLYIAQQFTKTETFKEASLSSFDWKWLSLAIVAGGIIAPISLMTGLVKVSASSASLLLNIESVFTAIIAWFVFKEHVNFSLAFGMVLIVIGSVILSWKGQSDPGSYIGVLFIAGACLGWAIDNNLTRKISSANPLQISFFKCLIAGLTNTSLAFLYIRELPDIKTCLFASAVGFIGYGLSLVFFVLGLRHIGAARTGAYFSLAPFIGAGIAIALLGDHVSTQFVIASIFMGVGIWLHIIEYHAHKHQHDAMRHSHSHTHDEHHLHKHQPGDPAGEPHSHSHKHLPSTHSHPHFPDIHHQHKH